MPVHHLKPTIENLVLDGKFKTLDKLVKNRYPEDTWYLVLMSVGINAPDKFVRYLKMYGGSPRTSPTKSGKGSTHVGLYPIQIHTLQDTHFWHFSNRTVLDTIINLKPNEWIGSLTKWQNLCERIGDRHEIIDLLNTMEKNGLVFRNCYWNFMRCPGFVIKRVIKSLDENTNEMMDHDCCVEAIQNNPDSRVVSILFNYGFGGERLLSEPSVKTRPDLWPELFDTGILTQDNYHLLLANIPPNKSLRRFHRYISKIELDLPEPTGPILDSLYNEPNVLYGYLMRHPSEQMIPVLKANQKLVEDMLLYRGNLFHGAIQLLIAAGFDFKEYLDQMIESEISVHLKLIIGLIGGKAGFCRDIPT